MAQGFQGRTALVTGAAHGIGRSVAVELGRRGARVFAADILPGELEATVDAVAAGKSVV